MESFHNEQGGIVLFYLETFCENRQREDCRVIVCDEFTLVKQTLQTENWKRFVITELTIIKNVRT